jgi:hypothetical protein
VETVDKKKRRPQKPENGTKMEKEGKPLEDVIATIHVLRNKTEVKKRIVKRHKQIEEV